MQKSLQWNISCDQWWANLDQAPEDLDKNIFRDLSPTPKPWVLEVLSTQAHFFGAALETVAENSRYVVDSDNTQHPTATSTSQNVAVVLNIFFLGVYIE